MQNTTITTLSELEQLLQANLDLMAAARWSTDIEADFGRERSFVGWGLEPQPAAEAAWTSYIEDVAGARLDYEDEYRLARSIRRVRSELERRGYEPLQLEDGRWLVAGPGLCAYVGDTVEEAIHRALEYADIFTATGAKLYVFAAQLIDQDPDVDLGAYFVLPASEPVDTGITAPEM